MTGAATTVGDDRGGALHDRLPVRVGHVGDQHIAFLHLVHLVQAGNDLGLAGTDARTDGTAFGEDFATLLELVTLQHVAAAALHGFRACLHDVQLAVDTVERPFDIHRALVVFFNRHCLARQLFNLLVGDAELVALIGIHIDDLDRLFAALRIDHLDRLAADVTTQHCRLVGRQGRLVHVELVGVDRALHDHLAQAVAGGHEHRVAEAAFGVQGEHHAAGADVGTNHFLHAGRQRDQRVVKALVHAVGDGAVVEQRGEHLVHAGFHMRQAADIEHGFLLTGEGRIRQVFSSRRRAHRPADLGAVLFFKRGVGRFERGIESRRKRGVHDPAADLGADLGQLAHIVDIQLVEFGVDPVGQALVSQKLAISMRGGGKATRHLDLPIGGQVTQHFTERGILATYFLDVAHLHFVQAQDVFVHLFLYWQFGTVTQSGSLWCSAKFQQDLPLRNFNTCRYRP